MIGINWKRSPVLPIADTQSTAGKKHHAWPIIGGDTSTSKRCRTISTDLSRMSIDLIKKFWKSRQKTFQLMMTGITPPKLNEVNHPAPSAPWQISQLAHIMYNMLMEDPDFDAPMIELLRIPPADPSESNIRLFMSAELAQLSSHLAVMANKLARQGQIQRISLRTSRTRMTK